ncbi:MAG TPA: hypothetical protein VGE47_07275 [Burkholderiaceae bacterium]
MRWRYSAGELAALARRWGAFIGVVAALLGSFAVQAIGWPILPLLWACAEAPRLMPLVMLAHALPAALLAWGLREALLPRAWLQAERSLPLPRWQRHGADLLVIALAQAPLHALYLLSLLGWRYVRPAWMEGLWSLALLAWLGSALTGLLLALALLQLYRRPARATTVRHASALGRTRGGVWLALIVLPLWRGPARPVMLPLLLALPCLLTLLLTAWCVPAQADWCLAGYALVAMWACSRAHASALRCYAPLMEASGTLPLAPRAWHSRLMALATIPVWLSWPLLLALLLSGPWRLGTIAAPLYLLAAALMPLVAIWAPQHKNEVRAARWLLCLIVWVALATECLQG